jgi:hypothetical protein
MMRFAKRLLIAGSVLALLLGMGVPASTAGGTPIGPHQAFVGSVNGQFRNATIDMACFGPTLPGQTGHPMKDQMLEIYSPPPPIVFGPPVKVGNTGAAATSVTALVIAGGKVRARMRLGEYFAPKAISTRVLLPCAGTGVVRFLPRPWSEGAKIAALKVSFVGQP